MPEADSAQTPALQKLAQRPTMVPIAPPRANRKVVNTGGSEVVAYIIFTGAPVAGTAGCVFRFISFSPTNRAIVDRVGKHILSLPQPAMCHVPLERKLNALEATRPVIRLHVDCSEIGERSVAC